MAPETVHGTSIPHESVRLDAERIQAILNRIEGANTTREQVNRTGGRYSYRTPTILHVRQNGNGNLSVAFRVPTRNLSRGGLAFLHKSFLHRGTPCTVQLATTRGHWVDVQGKVIRCRYLEAGIHEVALQFNEEIDPAEFCAGAAQCRVLIAEDDPMVAKLVQFHLDKLNVEYDHAEDGQKALAMANSNAYDLVLLDMDMPVVDGFEVIRKLRESGYTGMVVATTAMTQQGDREKCMTAGCDAYMAKPYTAQGLADLIASLHEEPLYSTLSGDPSMAPLVKTFVLSLSAKAKALEESVGENDRQRLAGLVRQIKGQGGSFGFESISQKAIAIETALVEGMTGEPLHQAVEELVALCRRARSRG